jgi:hypothetical protein
MDATSRAGTNYTSGAPEFTTGFKMEFVLVDRVFSIAFCRYMHLFVFSSLYCLFYLRLLISHLVTMIVAHSKMYYKHTKFVNNI